MSKSVKQILPKALALASVTFVAATLSACGGGEHHEPVEAPDKVEEAAELARANAPEPEVIEFETTPAPQTDMADSEASAETDAESSEADTDVEASSADGSAATSTAMEAESAEASVETTSTSPTNDSADAEPVN